MGGTFNFSKLTKWEMLILMAITCVLSLLAEAQRSDVTTFPICWY